MQRTASPRGGIRRVLFALLLAVPLAWVPAVQADVVYDGPGSSGVVPVGDGGAGARNGTGEDVTFVRVAGIPASACRLDLEPDLGTALEWQAAATEALVYAEPGRSNAPFRFRAHWLPDLNDACTVEVTPDGPVYHDPRGRPFVRLEARPDETRFTVAAGRVALLNATLTNTGTVEDMVNARLSNAPPEWELRWTHEHRRVPIGPERSLRFTQEVEVPADARGFYSITVMWVAVESGVETKTTLILDVAAAPSVQKAVERNQEEAASGPEVVRPPRQFVWEAPAPVTPLLVALLALVTLARRHSSSWARIGRRGSP